MRTFSPAKTRLLFIALCAALLCALSNGAAAQTLARPGWAGSGLSAEPWWRAAVFYRISVAGFQDSDGDSIGDLPGIAQRLDYLQSLGVDALVLEGGPDDSGFDLLFAEAGRRHVRLLVELSTAHDETLLPQARQWLARGVAGLWLRVERGTTADRASALVHGLRTLADSFPGQRVLVEDTSGNPAVWPVGGAELVVRTISANMCAAPDPVLLRLELANAQNVPPGSAPLLMAAGPAQNSCEVADASAGKVLAAALLASRAATAWEYGQEIGLGAPRKGDVARLMQWTPSNITPPSPPAEDQAKPSPPREEVYGRYVPFTPPDETKPAQSGEDAYGRFVPYTPAPEEAAPAQSHEDVYGPFVPYAPPKKVEKAAPSVKPDQNTLPGFTSGTLPKTSAEALPATLNVAAEDLDPESLLGFYRKLAQLHHGDAAVRSGAMFVLDHDAERAVVWVRRAPADARTVSTVVVACNLSASALMLSLRGDLNQLRLRGGDLRVLLASPRSNAYVLQSTDTLTLSPGSVLVGEVGR